MERIFNILRFVLICHVYTAQCEQTLFPDDPKGLNLPPSVPRMVDTNGNVVWLDHDFTSPQYRQAAFKMVMEEANLVAIQLQLPGEFPIVESNLVEAIVTPFGFNYVNKTIGSVSSRNYCYYVSRGNKFCFLEGTHQTEDCYKLAELYTWPLSQINTNEAYQLSTQWLAAVSMDVRGMNSDCSVTVEVDKFFGHPTVGKFVPIYDVIWTRRGFEKRDDLPSVLQGTVASVRVATPARKLLQLRVEDPQYILRKPLVFTNLNSLLPGKAKIYVEPPPKLGGRVGT